MCSGEFDSMPCACSTGDVWLPPLPLRCRICKPPPLLPLRSVGGSGSAQPLLTARCRPSPPPPLAVRCGVRMALPPPALARLGCEEDAPSAQAPASDPDACVSSSVSVSPPSSDCPPSGIAATCVAPAASGANGWPARAAALAAFRASFLSFCTSRASRMSCFMSDTTLFVLDAALLAVLAVQAASLLAPFFQPDFL